MSSNDTESVSDCTTESGNRFFDLCDVDTSSTSSGGNSVAAHYDQRDSTKKHKYKKRHSISQLRSSSQLNRDVLSSHRKSSNSNSPSRVSPSHARGKQEVSTVSKRASLSNLTLTFDGDSHSSSKSMDSASDSACSGGTSSSTEATASRTGNSPGKTGSLIRHRGRRFKIAPVDTLAEMVIEDGSSLEPSVHIPKPPQEKYAFSAKTLPPHQPLNFLEGVAIPKENAPPPSIDIVAPTPTLSIISASTIKCDPFLDTITAPSLLNIKSPYYEWVSSGTSSSGTISPMPGTMRSSSANSNSSCERKTLPPLKKTPALRRRNLLPPITPQEHNLSLSSCSSYGSNSRTPSPCTSKLTPPRSSISSPVSDHTVCSQTKTQDEKSSRQQEHGVKTQHDQGFNMQQDFISNRQASAMLHPSSLSPLLQYVRSQQAIQYSTEAYDQEYHPTKPLSPIIPSKKTSVRPSLSSTKDLTAPIPGIKQDVRHFTESSSSSTGAGTEQSFTSTSSMDVEAKSQDDDPTDNMFLLPNINKPEKPPDVRPKSVKVTVFDGLSSDFKQGRSSYSSLSESLANTRSKSRSGSKKKSVGRMQHTPKERTRVSDDSMMILGTHKKTHLYTKTSKSFDHYSPSHSPIVQRKLTRSGDAYCLADVRENKTGDCCDDVERKQLRVRGCGVTKGK